MFGQEEAIGRMTVQSITRTMPGMVRSTDRVPGPSSRALLLCFVLLLEQLGAFLQRVLELGLRDEQHVIRKQLLAWQALRDLLEPFGIFVVLAQRSGRAEADRVVVALQLAHLDRVGEAVEGARVDGDRLLEHRALGRHVGELQHAERVGRGVGSRDLELLAGLGAVEAPVGVVARALDAIAAPVGVAHLEGLDLLHLEGGLVDPLGSAGGGLVERIGNDVDDLGVAGERYEASVGARLLGIVDLALELLLADDELRQRLAVGAGKLHLGAAVVEIEPRAILVADRLALAHLQGKRLQDEFAHLGHVGRKIAALGDHPAVVLLLHGERGFGRDDADRGHVGGLEVLEDAAAERGDIVGAPVALLVLVKKRAAAEDGEQHYENNGEACVHAVLLLRIRATSRPMSATSSGIAAMLATLVQNTRPSASWRRFLRTSLSARRASATVLRKRSISACCSGLRICADLPPGPWAFCSSWSLAVVFCTSSSSAWILPKYCFCASASSSRTTVSGRKAPVRLRSEMKSSPAANCSTMPIAKARLPLEGTTILRPNTSCTSTAAPSARRSTSATRITEFSLADSRSPGVFGTGLAFSCLSPCGFSASFSPSGKAVLNLPVRRKASGIDWPEGLNALVASSPDLVAFTLSTSMELGELFTSSVARRPSGVLTSNAPPNANSSVSICPVTMSSR